MSRIDEVQMLRVTDDTQSVLVCTCVPRSARGHVRMGNPEDWESGKQVSCIAIDTNALLQIDDPSVISAIGSWLSGAAMWLKAQQMRDEADDLEADWEEESDDTQEEE
jgi:hypothetical protein